MSKHNIMTANLLNSDVDVLNDNINPLQHSSDACSQQSLVVSSSSETKMDLFVQARTETAATTTLTRENSSVLEGNSQNQERNRVLQLASVFAKAVSELATTVFS